MYQEYLDVIIGFMVDVLDIIKIDVFSFKSMFDIQLLISVLSLIIAMTNLMMNCLIKKKTEEPNEDLQKVATIVTENNEITKLIRRDTILEFSNRSLPV